MASRCKPITKACSSAQNKSTKISVKSKHFKYFEKTSAKFLTKIMKIFQEPKVVLISCILNCSS